VLIQKVIYQAVNAYNLFALTKRPFVKEVTDFHQIVFIFILFPASNK
jgi:hypothetical protein